MDAIGDDKSFVMLDSTTLYIKSKQLDTLCTLKNIAVVHLKIKKISAMNLLFDMSIQHNQSQKINVALTMPPQLQIKISKVKIFKIYSSSSNYHLW